jgi:hypothetical protein
MFDALDPLTELTQHIPPPAPEDAVTTNAGLRKVWHHIAKPNCPSSSGSPT